jgi:hypothetical protein
MGFEPIIFGSVVQRLIHWASRTYIIKFIDYIYTYLYFFYLKNKQKRNDGKINKTVFFFKKKIYLIFTTTTTTTRTKKNRGINI